MRGSVTIFGLALLLAAANAMADEGEGTAGSEAVESTQEAADSAKTETQSAAAEAGLKGSESGGPAKYGPAGCGLGSMIFDPDSGFTQIFAATTNATSGTQTFGITTGTSNCDTGPGSSSSAKAFVETNRSALAKDAARGRGETISSLSELAGCEDSAAVGKKLQKNFKKVFTSAKASDDQISENVVEMLKNDESLSCTNLT
jgi:hypothetical protein